MATVGPSTQRRQALKLPPVASAKSLSLSTTQRPPTKLAHVGKEPLALSDSIGRKPLNLPAIEPARAAAFHPTTADPPRHAANPVQRGALPLHSQRDASVHPRPTPLRLPEQLPLRHPQSLSVAAPDSPPRSRPLTLPSTVGVQRDHQLPTLTAPNRVPSSAPMSVPAPVAVTTPASPEPRFKPPVSQRNRGERRTAITYSDL